LILHLLVTGWFDLTVTGAWLTLQRWERFPLFCRHVCFSLCVGGSAGPVIEPRKRLGLDYLAILLAWLVLVFGTFVLHNGQILVVLLMPISHFSFSSCAWVHDWYASARLPPRPPPSSVLYF